MQRLARLLGGLLFLIIAAAAVGLSGEDGGEDFDGFMVGVGFALKERVIHDGVVDGYEHIPLRFVLGLNHAYVLSVSERIRTLFSA